MLKEFISLFFPHCCTGCQEPLEDTSQQICLKCRFHIPQTGFDQIPDNPVEKLLWGKARIKAATSCFYFRKNSSLQNIIHDLKYRNNQKVGVELGEWIGTVLHDHPRFPPPDYLVPVPLHPKKERLRGYNQSQLLATGMGHKTGASISGDNLVRTVHTASQTQKGHYDRFQNMNTNFDVLRPEQFEGKRIWLIDDVVTTGSTLAECASTLQRVPNIEIFAVTVGVAS